MRKPNTINNLLSAGNSFPVIGVGASAGGLEAFKLFVGSIPQDCGMAFILMQHMDASYETVLGDILQKETSLPIKDFSEKTALSADVIYIMPSDKMLVVENNGLQLKQREGKDNSLHSIDVFFTAIAEVFQNFSIGVLLSGMGSDGTEGLKKIQDKGGVTFTQLPASAKFPAMPQHAVESNAADFSLIPEDIIRQLLQIKNTLRLIPSTDIKPLDDIDDEMNFKQILHLLLIRKEVDFTFYKQTTIRRRILRRMVVNKMEQVSAYLLLLQENVTEQDILYNDLLIPVTCFFRDTTVFESLCKKIIPEIFANKHSATPVRIWIAGCSTGEEAYSIAICLYEYLGEKIAGLKVQLFATDISEKAIQKARSGIYSAREVEGMDFKRLTEYFTKTDGSYLVKKAIRDLCVFATHNFLKDPPFAKMDLITCRNVLIYMESYLQQKALATFHYALNEKGILLLGKSETAGSTDLFKVTGKQEKLYVKKSITGRSVRFLPERTQKNMRMVEQVSQKNSAGKEDFQKNADEILLSNYTPAGVVVNEHLEIVHFRGSTGPFLEAAPGKASFNILKMAKEGLSFEIRNALHKARETKETFIKKDISIQDGKVLVTIEAVPLLQTIEPYYLILFNQTVVEEKDNVLSNENKEKNSTTSHEQKRIQQLEKDLAQLKQDMRIITEDQEAANEELQSANEELLSGSEELQSVNEELETSKEELQSTNEELMTVNQELYERNEQYNQARIYSEAIINTIREPLLILDRDLRIKSANPSFYNFFKFSENEISGKILFELQNNKWDIPDLRTKLLQIQTGQINQLEWEVSFVLPDLGQRILMLNVQPLKMGNGQLLILLAFVDITLHKNEAARLLASAEKLEKDFKLMEDFFLKVPALFCVLRGANHIFEFANPRYIQVSGGFDLKGKKFSEAFPELENAGYKKILDNVFNTGESFFGKEMKATHYPDKQSPSEIYMDLSCQAYKNDNGEIEGVFFFSYEVTEQVFARREIEKNATNLENRIEERTSSLQRVNEALKHSNKNLQEFASIASHDLQEPLRKIKTFITILTGKYQPGLEEEAGMLLSKINQAAERMSVLIRDVLNYSRVLPENTFTLTNLNSIINNVINDFDLLIEEKKAVIQFDENLPLIEAVPSQLNQLFYNLLGNSLKFSKEESSPLINISGEMLSKKEIAAFTELDKNAEYFKITFEDNGIGFEPKFAEQIFLIFERLNSTSKFAGTGIGLALCRRIINNHNGIIWCESNPHKTTRFFIILPVRQSGTNIVANDQDKV